MKTYITLRVWEKTFRVLKILAACQGETMITLVDRLVVEECARQNIPIPQPKKDVPHG